MKLKFILQRTFQFLILMFLIQSCKTENDLGIKSPAFIKDQYGRVLILHGLNTSSSAKSHPLRNPWIIESDVEREATEFGFNMVRYLIFWDAIEPEKDVFDEEYLDRVQERVEWYTSRKMYVMLDMHQDIYSIVFGGDGAPLWAVRTNGEPIQMLGVDGPWWLQNINPAVINAFQNFFQYDKHKDLQDHYILSWLKVVERFKDNPYVLGYDLMNEPHGGDLIKTLSVEFEGVQLYNFYNRLIKAIREVDQEKYIIFEPRSLAVNFGSESFLPKVKDTRIGEEKLIYSPHCYPFLLHEGQPYQILDSLNLVQWVKHRKNDLQVQGTSMIVGEFGVGPDVIGFDKFLDDFMDICDNLFASWAYWSNDQGGWSPLNGDRSETPILPLLVRPYARAIAGIPTKMGYNRQTNIYELEFTPDLSINQPTEIFVPNRHFPDGYDVTVEGSSDFTVEKKIGEQLVLVKIKSNSSTVKVKVSSL